MYVVLAAVMSIDGKIKRNEQIHKRDWISDEDKSYFAQLIAEHDVIVMGRKTYQSMKVNMQPGKRYVVITRQPEKYRRKTITNELEFTDDTPDVLIDRLRDFGEHSNLLVVGGSEVYGAFLRLRLVDELRITVEPILLGSGTPLIANEVLEERFQLVEFRKLNHSGTILMSMKPSDR